MSSFYCEKCGALISDSEKGYLTGCEHYPVEIEPITGLNLEGVIKKPEQKLKVKVKDDPYSTNKRH